MSPSRNSIEALPGVWQTGPVNKVVPHSSVPKVIAVVGPTAAGKSDLGATLARTLGGEVVNADSMQLYRGMDIGTAKLTPRQNAAECRTTCWTSGTSPQAASVAEYQRLARVEIDRLLAAGRSAVLVGGSGLYVRAAIDALEFPGTDPEVRARLEAELETRGTRRPARPARRRRPGGGPQRSCPATAAASCAPWRSSRSPAAPSPPTSPATRRSTTPCRSASTSPGPSSTSASPSASTGCGRRGSSDEVRALEAVGLREGRTASRALGYQQVLAHFAGECTEDEARAETVRATKRFARRQDSWFRRDPRVHWLTGRRRRNSPSGH